MPSAALLRKTMLSVLQEQIIPDLRDKGARRLVTARLPLKVPAGFAVREMSHPPLAEADAKRIYPAGKTWDAVGMHALQFPALYCVVEGEADLLMGVTTSMLSQVTEQDKSERPSGGYIISLPAPAYCLFPPGVPQRTGATPPWRRAEPHLGNLCFFNVRVLPVGALCNITTMKDSLYQVGYSLLIKDNQLVAIMSILIDELSTAAADPQVTQAQLLTLMLRLERGMSAQVPVMTDGLYSRFPDGSPLGLEAESLHEPVVERAREYIQQRLQEPLTPAVIARQVRLTPTQLNRIFKANAGMSTMNYVAQLRMEAAQLLLRTSDLSVQEICRLVGYQQVPHFSRTFRHHTGHSPLKFRQQRASNS